MKAAIDKLAEHAFPSGEIVAFVVLTILKSLFDQMRSTIFNFARFVFVSFRRGAASIRWFDSPLTRARSGCMAGTFFGCVPPHTRSVDATKAANLILFSHLHALSLDFHFKRQTGAVMKTLDRGADAVSTFAEYLVFEMLSTSVDLLLILIILFQQFDYTICLIMLAMLVVYVAFTYVVTNWRTKMCVCSAPFVCSLIVVVLILCATGASE